MLERYNAYMARINDALKNCISDHNIRSAKLTEAMRYSLLGDGKRIRSVLTLAVCEACGGDLEDALPFACAVEMIHTYSLIHDDLPCMDNDDFRRGKPTSHKVYGEAMALLAGDALLTDAFRVLLTPMPRDPAAGLEAVHVLARLAGGEGMVEGQALELEGETNLTRIHVMKTGALFVAAAHLGYWAGQIAGRSKPEQLGAADYYAQYLSLAFQIQDDILDGDGFVPVLGLDACKAKVSELTAQAKDLLVEFDKPEFLLWLADFLAERER